MGVASLFVVMVTLNFLFASKYQSANIKNSNHTVKATHDQSNYYFPLAIGCMIFYKSMKGVVASKSQDLKHVQSANTRVATVGVAILIACVYKLSSSI